MPASRAAIAVHLPVPFWPALSRILVRSGSPSSSLNLRMLAVISMRKESRTPLFQVLKMSAISSSWRPRPRLRMSYASAISCMSPYSIPVVNICQKRSVGGKFRVNPLTVVHHLHVVTCTGLTDPVAARLAIDLSGGLLEDLLDVRPGSRRTTRHE